jgi:hypothetical protein
LKSLLFEPFGGSEVYGPFSMGNCSSGDSNPKRNVIQVNVKASGASDVAQRYAVGNRRVTSGFSGGAGDDVITYGEVKQYLN